MPSIQIELPDDRTQAGTLSLVNDFGITVAGPFPALGKAGNSIATRNGNPGRISIQPYGDTPLGDYASTGWLPTGPGTSRSLRSFGNNGVISLDPTGGDAGIAEVNGRTGIYIHGGDPGNLGPESLRPTAGCVRLSNGNMRRLVQAITVLAATQGPPSMSTAIPTLHVSVVAVDLNNEDTDIVDPPGPKVIGSPYPLPALTPMPSTS